MTRSAIRLLVDCKRLANDWLFNQSAPKERNRDAATDNLAVLENSNLLQILFEATAGNPGRLATVSTEILRLTAVLNRVSERRLVIAVLGKFLGQLNSLVLLQSAHITTTWFSQLSSGVLFDATVPKFTNRGGGRQGWEQTGRSCRTLFSSTG